MVSADAGQESAAGQISFGALQKPLIGFGGARLRRLLALEKKEWSLPVQEQSTSKNTEDEAGGLLP